MVVYPPIPTSQPPPTPEPAPDINMTLVDVPPLPGNASVAGAFKACLDILSDVCCINPLAKDWPDLQTKLDIERTLLLQWADKVKLLNDAHDRCLDLPDTHSQIINLLQTTYNMLTDNPGLAHYFSIITHEQVDSLPDATYLQSSWILSRPRMEKFNSEFARQNLQTLHVPDGTPSTNRILRVVTCKAGFQYFTENIRQLVNSLNRLASSPNCLECAAQMAREDVNECKRIEDLRKVRDAASGIRDTIALSAEKLIVEMARRRVLANLRFEGIHERKMNLQDPHPGTFEWALKTPEPDTEWDSLTEWLESGSGIYWVCGKAGAGKSTFLKYIYNHPETKRRLSIWGGDEPVSVGCYFFWKLGTIPQRTRDGMARVVLYHILRAMPHLIPILVPTMWKFAYEEGPLESYEALPLPSVSQVRDAFVKMADPNVLNMKFVFIVDGLDEYPGDAARAFAFLQMLCKSSKIKILAASRPSPVYVDLFATSPKLHLHELVGGDVLQYVQDKADTHRYMRALREVDETMALILIEKVAEKAGGVFLRAVLGTWILLQGFDGLERFVNLEQRIEAIPEDLEDLFAYVLGLIEPCHRKQVVKLFRICFRSKASRCAETERRRVWNRDMISVDENMDSDEFDRKSERTLRARHRQCLALENRLANRCGGLLEVIRSDGDAVADDKCLCATPEDHPHDDILIDSSIEFVHRSVYEWFAGLDSRALSQLDIPGRPFSEDSTLGSLSWQQCQEAREIGTPYLRADVDLANCMHNIERAEDFETRFADSMTRRIHGLVAETRDQRGLNWHHAFCCGAERDESECLEMLYFAVAMGMVNFVKYFLQKNPDAPSLSEMETRYKMRWWKVSVDRNLIRNLLEPFHETVQFLPTQGRMLLYLQSSGCVVPENQLRTYVRRHPVDRHRSIEPATSLL